MKKSIFILTALVAATCMNAQITLEKTFGQDWHIGAEVQVLQNCTIRNGSVTTDIQPLFLGQYFVDEHPIQNSNYDEAIYDIYDPKTLNLIKTFNSSDMAPADCYPYFISRGFFTTDNKWAWAYSKPSDTMYASDFCIVTEDNVELLRITIFDEYAYIIKVGEQYKLVVPGVQDGNSYVTQLYSLPGKGDSGQDISSPAAPRNSRKVLKKDQVLVENADKTYTLQGQEVK